MFSEAFNKSTLLIFDTCCDEKGLKNLQFSLQIIYSPNTIDMLCSNSKVFKDSESKVQSGESHILPSDISFKNEKAIQLKTENQNEKGVQGHLPILLQVACAKLSENVKSPLPEKSFLKVFKGGWQSDIDMDCRRIILVEM